MYKITCRSYDCSHNMAGACDAGVVSVREKTGKGAFCETYTLYSDEANATYDISPLGFKCYRRQGSIVCSMMSCTHLRDGICCAEAVLMQASRQKGSVFCASYMKKGEII